MIAPKLGQGLHLISSHYPVVAAAQIIPSFQLNQDWFHSIHTNGEWFKKLELERRIGRGASGQALWAISASSARGRSMRKVAPVSELVAEIVPPMSWMMR